MAFIKKLLFRNNSRTSVKYTAYALLFLYFLALLLILSIRYDLYTLFSHTKLSDSQQKYILFWDNQYLWNKVFPNYKCRVNNCTFTDDRYLLDGDYTRFHALLFTENVLKQRDIKLPEKRSKVQIYIFATIESSYNFPACEVYFDNFFNWTFTYRLDSDVHWPYFVVRNVARQIVAPSKHVQWQAYDENIPIPTEIQQILRGRKKAAAWLVSNCWADSLRNNYLTRLQEHLFHFSLQIDVYGGCSEAKCTHGNCEVMLRKEYYFYMAFENSFSEDYVTEKVLHGYDNYVVPIVFGAANYSRFLPPGSYINAREIHPYNLAYIMYQAMENQENYYEFFKWTNYYTVDSIAELQQLHPLCDLCEALNSNTRDQQSLKQFRHWWNGRGGLQWCLPNEYWNETSLLHEDRLPVFEMY